MTAASDVVIRRPDGSTHTVPAYDLAELRRLVSGRTGGGRWACAQCGGAVPGRFVFMHGASGSVRCAACRDD